MPNRHRTPRAAFRLSACVIVTVFFTTFAAAQTETVLHDFVMQSGTLPFSGVVLDSHDNIYGTTQNGGRQSVGTVYELSPSSGGGWTYTVLHNFSYKVANDGFYSVSTPIFNAGNLYGTTLWGGAADDGTVFEMVQQSDGTWNEKLIYSFHGTDGQFAEASITADASGNLYGTTTYGGSTFGTTECEGSAESGCGVVFQLKPDANGGWVERVLWNFSKNGTDGLNPTGGVVFDAAGNLYGTTLFGGTYNYGIVFELSPTTSGEWKETILHSFDHNGTDGFFPSTGKLVFDAHGNLYGTTEDGGSGNNPQGTIFRLEPSSSGTWTETIIRSFQVAGGNGAVPNGSLIFDASGNLYGTTEFGGDFHNGTVFELSPASGGRWTIKNLHSFGAYPDGSFPVSGVTFDSIGNLYGSSENGGTGKNVGNCSYYNCGTVFEVTP